MLEAEVHGQSRRRSREEAARLAWEFEQSGLTRRAFCHTHGISPATLDNFRKRRARDRQQGIAGTNPATLSAPFSAFAPPVTQRPSITFVPLEVIESSTQTASEHEADSCPLLFVELRHGRRIGVIAGFDASTLTRLIAVLEQV